MSEKSIAYYLEHPEEIQDVSEDTLQSWKKQYPYSQAIQFLIAKKDGFIENLSEYKAGHSLYFNNRPSFYSSLIYPPALSRNIQEASDTDETKKLIDRKLEDEFESVEHFHAGNGDSQSVKTKSDSDLLNIDDSEQEKPISSVEINNNGIDSGKEEKLLSLEKSELVKGDKEPADVDDLQADGNVIEEKTEELPYGVQKEDELNLDFQVISIPPLFISKLEKKKKKKNKKRKISKVKSRTKKKTSNKKTKKASGKNKKLRIEPTLPSPNFTASLFQEKKKKKKKKKRKKKAIQSQALANKISLQAENNSQSEITSHYEGTQISSFANWLMKHQYDKQSTPISYHQGDALKAGTGLEEKKDQKPKSKEAEEKLHTLANYSIQEDETLVSEKLAALLAEQKHYKKAKKMYKKLGLIFPEKSAYFAAQIEKLKQSKK